MDKYKRLTRIILICLFLMGALMMVACVRPTLTPGASGTTPAPNTGQTPGNPYPEPVDTTIPGSPYPVPAAETPVSSTAYP